MTDSAEAYGSSYIVHSNGSGEFPALRHVRSQVMRGLTLLAVALPLLFQACDVTSAVCLAFEGGAVSGTLYFSVVAPMIIWVVAAFSEVAFCLADAGTSHNGLLLAALVLGPVIPVSIMTNGFGQQKRASATANSGDSAHNVNGAPSEVQGLLPCEIWRRKNKEAASVYGDADSLAWHALQASCRMLRRSNYFWFRFGQCASLFACRVVAELLRWGSPGPIPILAESPLEAAALSFGALATACMVGVVLLPSISFHGRKLKALVLVADACTSMLLLVNRSAELSWDYCSVADFIQLNCYRSDLPLSSLFLFYKCAFLHVAALFTAVYAYAYEVHEGIIVKRRNYGIVECELLIAPVFIAIGLLLFSLAATIGSIFVHAAFYLLIFHTWFEPNNNPARPQRMKHDSFSAMELIFGFILGGCGAGQQASHKNAEVFRRYKFALHELAENEEHRYLRHFSNVHSTYDLSFNETQRIRCCRMRWMTRWWRCPQQLDCGEVRDLVDLRVGNDRVVAEQSESEQRKRRAWFDDAGNCRRLPLPSFSRIAVVTCPSQVFQMLVAPLDEVKNVWRDFFVVSDTILRQQPKPKADATQHRRWRKPRYYASLAMTRILALLFCSAIISFFALSVFTVGLPIVAASEVLWPIPSRPMDPIAVVNTVLVALFSACWLFLWKSRGTVLLYCGFLLDLFVPSPRQWHEASIRRELIRYFFPHPEELFMAPRHKQQENSTSIPIASHGLFEDENIVPTRLLPGDVLAAVASFMRRGDIHPSSTQKVAATGEPIGSAVQFLKNQSTSENSDDLVECKFLCCP